MTGRDVIAVGEWMLEGDSQGLLGNAAEGVRMAGFYGQGSGSAVFLVHAGESPAGAHG